ncbi:SH3 domain-containing protein [Virgibacillus salinus]|uniref:Beta-N-acetylglucosaminidase n=1 Tax=Virgibacillus salinus TaxID=553311 RepID=A0A1H0YGP0_9BACI|nr:SH3 domain-containing protein [Virgibacillus salinus]SDQ14377.1 Beta-N-acetylglucosaminidase [Virgibacillus salinus]
MVNLQQRKLILSFLFAICMLVTIIPINEYKVSAAEIHRGVALKDTTNVYQSKDRDAKVLKDYSEGTILYYQSNSGNWFMATVFVNGKAQDGYIHKSDVDTASVGQSVLNGVSLKSPTSIYSKASTNSSKLKSYNIGSTLYYRDFASDWYVATVSVNGEAREGFIHKSHIGEAVKSNRVLKGIGLKSPTSVYNEASTSSKSLRSYSKGSILYYQPFTTNWYKATVSVNGNHRTGYIHRSHVENASAGNTVLNGVSLKKPTSIYSKASTNSNKLKSYKIGSTLYYRNFSSDWYIATISVNGKSRDGYIHKSHVEKAAETSGLLSGKSLKQPTAVFREASTSSKSLKTYDKNIVLYYEPFTTNWYKATVSVNGKNRTGYIHTNHVATGDTSVGHKYNETNYDSDFYEVVDTQMKRAPQVWRSGGFVDASEEQVAYYVNSSNFHKDDNSFFQFLDLSEPAGVDAKEIDQNILNNKGTLSGQAQAFIDGANEYNTNEIYLMAHAIHETGNGTSELAQGVTYNGETVYNMYGIGAYDDCAVECGAEHAFEQGWFTPEEAIIGGAAFIGRNYINDGQNTLYKMRWNPDKPGDHQYATDVAWAVSQTSNISNLYNLIENYVLVFDIPKYDNQPNESGDPYAYETKYPDGLYGITDTGSDNLNFRDAPNGDRIGSIPDGSKIEVIGFNGAWLYVKYDGKTGWVHGDYVNLLNLLEVTATDLNVRPKPNTSNDPIGQIEDSGTLIAGVLNDNKMVKQKADGYVWYKIYYNGQVAWVSSGSTSNPNEFVKVVK